MDDSTNPYATPDSSVERERQPTGGSQIGKGSFDLGECLKDGWDNTIKNIGPVLGVMFLGIVMMMVSYVTIIGIFLLVPVIFWGQTKFLLNTHDGRCDFEDLFSGFRKYGKVLPQMLLLGILIMLISIVGSVIQYVGMFAENEILMIVGGLVSMAWTILIMSRLYWALLFVVDQEMDAVSALQAAWNATKSQWLMCMALVIVAGIVSFLGILACGVGVFISIPVGYFMYVSAYRQTVGRPGPAYVN